MPQLQLEPEVRRPPSRATPPAGSSTEDEDWVSTFAESVGATTAATEYDELEDQRRARHAAAFAGCVRGGATEMMAQLLVGGGGGDEFLVHGVGNWLANDHPDDPLPHLRTKPIVYCHPRLMDGTEGRLLLASDHPELIRYLGFITGGEQPPGELLAMGTDAAVEHWAPGSVIVGSSSGTLGTYCTWNGVDAILTAGHVTDGQKTVTDGSVTASVRVECHAGSSLVPLAVGPDVAVIELPARSVGGPLLTARTTPLLPSEPLTLFGGSAVGHVLAVSSWLRVQQRSGCWGNVHQLNAAIGRPGQSGSAVVDSAGLLVGHYLGALGGMAVVQDIGYQISELARYGVTIP